MGRRRSAGLLRKSVNSAVLPGQSLAGARISFFEYWVGKDALISITEPDCHGR